MADSKLPDQQAGHEKGLTVALAANAGANIVYESAGTLASLLACSAECMVIDNDMLGSVMRTVRGIEINTDSLSTTVIEDVIANGWGHFLGSEQTLAIMLTEYTYPLVGNRLSPDNWIDAGAKTARMLAEEYVAKTMAAHVPNHLTPQADAEIRAKFPIHLAPLYG
jgi:trimethylamine--corrinoid protein Co-methyltransferase